MAKNLSVAFIAVLLGIGISYYLHIKCISPFSCPEVDVPLPTENVFVAQPLSDTSTWNVTVVVTQANRKTNPPTVKPVVNAKVTFECTGAVGYTNSSGMVRIEGFMRPCPCTNTQKIKVECDLGTKDVTMERGCGTYDVRY